MCLFAPPAIPYGPPISTHPWVLCDTPIGPPYSDRPPLPHRPPRLTPGPPWP